jgi:hypothetical protein
MTIKYEDNRQKKSYASKGGTEMREELLTIYYRLHNLKHDQGLSLGASTHLDACVQSLNRALLFAVDPDEAKRES